MTHESTVDGRTHELVSIYDRTGRPSCVRIRDVVTGRLVIAICSGWMSRRGVSTWLARVFETVTSKKCAFAFDRLDEFADRTHAGRTARSRPDVRTFPTTLGFKAARRRMLQSKWSSLCVSRSRGGEGARASE